MLSVIIPALNEERALPGTLRALLAQPGDFEILVVDGGSSDATVAIATGHNRVRLLSAPEGRGRQMNAGAAAAENELLLFLHADTLLPDGATEDLRLLADLESPVFGGFHHRFSGRGISLAVVSRLHNLRCRFTGVFYGDQAMFVSKDLFERVGGFPEAGEMEDIRLSEKLLQHVVPSFLDLTVTTDSRKFEQLGPWRALRMCFAILLRDGHGREPGNRRFFAAYR